MKSEKRQHVDSFGRPTFEPSTEVGHPERPAGGPVHRLRRLGGRHGGGGLPLHDQPAGLVGLVRGDRARPRRHPDDVAGRRRASPRPGGPRPATRPRSSAPRQPEMTERPSGRREFFRSSRWAARPPWAPAPRGRRARVGAGPARWRRERHALQPGGRAAAHADGEGRQRRLHHGRREDAEVPVRLQSRRLHLPDDRLHLHHLAVRCTATSWPCGIRA